ncbi:MAG: flavodoxin family protein [Asgard group archaeon]|nr:flavodoxin family protein [Asgard group archaeon]
MSSLVIYDSKTGNTQKIAEKIAEGLNCKAYPYQEIPSILFYDLLVFGGWLKKGFIRTNFYQFIKDLLNKELEGKKAALFLTCTFPTKKDKISGNTYLDQTFSELEKLLQKKNCQVYPKKFHAIGAAKLFKWGKGFIKRGYPTTDSLEKARQYGITLKNDFL